MSELTTATASLETPYPYKNGLEMIHRAWLFAVESHGDQKYGGTEIPYSYHLANVALELLDARGGKVHNAHVIATAVLHDTIEDTRRKEAREAKSAKITVLFPEPVVRGVDGMTYYKRAALLPGWSKAAPLSLWLSCTSEEKRRNKVEKARRNPISHVVK
ncbi:MAG: hypothetical protein LBQ11_02070, partial [Candidatus Nomurabacteria bacterium]|nr:hypothetical protein [Candidatus Nomurabacteria bacterium]